MTQRKKTTDKTLSESKSEPMQPKVSLGITFCSYCKSRSELRRLLQPRSVRLDLLRLEEHVEEGRQETDYCECAADDRANRRDELVPMLALLRDVN